MQSKRPDDSTNLILSLVLSMAVLLAWQMFFAPIPTPKKPQETQSEEGGELAAGQKPGAPGKASREASLIPREAAIAKTKRIAVETPSLRGSINLKGGRIDDLILVKYRETIKPDSANVLLFSPAGTKTAYFAEQGWVPPPGSTLKLPDRDTIWTAKDGARLSDASPVELTWDNGAGLLFRRTIRVDEHYMFSITDTVENSSGHEIALFPYARIYRYGTPKIEGFFVQHEGLIGWLGEHDLEKITYADALAPNGSMTYENTKGGWLGFTDKYWAAILIPDQKVSFTGNLKLAEEKTEKSLESFQADYISALVVVPDGATKSVSSRLFAGAKKVQLVEAYEAKANPFPYDILVSWGLMEGKENKDSILQFDYLIDWGWFDFITYPLFLLIDWFYKLFGNFGFAILAVTVVVKLFFFPIANRAYESMAQIKALQPDIEALRERYKDDQQRLQQEIMKLYGEKKVNPLTGCLPMLLQIPVFFALYKVLFISIDMRHAPFVGWIQDLSAPDPTSIFNLFGLLPYSVPGFLLIGVWPLIMGVTMWLQMQLNPPQPDPTQQAIFNWMPVFFTFLLATFPAGLVIYWAWNNVLSLVQQYYILKKNNVEVALMDNLKKTFAAVANFRRANRE